jgi:hypothetical protein
MPSSGNEYAVLTKLADGSCATVAFATDLRKAEEKMRELAHNFGGEYFVKDPIEQTVVALIHVKKR